MTELLDLPSIRDIRGNLTFIESSKSVPFDIKRVYYLHDVPAGAERGGHAHVNLRQLLVAVSGSFDVLLDNGLSRTTFTLDDPTKGLLIESMTWRELLNFAPNTVCLVLASEHYGEEDYIRDYVDFSKRLVPDGGS